jgi:hypothetical protein
VLTALNLLYWITDFNQLMGSQEYLTELPPQLGLLRNLRNLKLGGTRLSSPPAELIAQGTDAVMRFLRDGVEVRECMQT